MPKWYLDGPGMPVPTDSLVAQWLEESSQSAPLHDFRVTNSDPKVLCSLAACWGAEHELVHCYAHVDTNHGANAATMLWKARRLLAPPPG